MKTIFFDFDGTLSYKCPNAWRKIDEYVVQKNSAQNQTYKIYLNKFLSGEIDYKEWCKMVSASLKLCNFHISTLNKVATEMRLIPDAYETFKILKEKGYRIQIVSGGIRDIIIHTLGDSVKFIDGISCNKLIFDKNGNFEKIVATEYDYKGKAKCINDYMRLTTTNKNDIIFVGNSSNDEWVWTTGVKTICINPDGADIANKQKWNIAYPEVNSLLDILPELSFADEKVNKCDEQYPICKFKNLIKFGKDNLINEKENIFGK